MKGSNGIAKGDKNGIQLDAIPSAPSPMPEDEPEKIGTWLCEEGKCYQIYT